MGAIAGIYSVGGEPIQEESSELMMSALGKYPADHSAVWQQDHIMLGCHAQWITEQASQELLPYYDSQRGLAITADAILDNRDELMSQLDVPYGQRSLVTDSEILLLAYEKWSDYMAEHLVGDFAFAIWDERKQLLFGARDFSGTRTLYYHHDDQQFSFCTIMTPLLALPYIRKELNERWLAEFLAIHGVFEPPDTSTTVYRHIYQIPPSHSFIIKHNRLHISRYDSLANVHPLQLRSSAEYEEAFREVFQKAVTSRLRRSSLQIGAHLSGGLDSGSVASFAARALQQENRMLHTFSYVPESGFKDWTPKHRFADERPLIRQTVQFVGNIKDHYLDFKGHSPFTEIDDWLDIMESPYKFFDNSFWLRGIYTQAQQRGIGILLNGARGNYSISWGPAIEYYTMLLKKFRWLHLTREINQFSRNIGVGRKQLYSLLCHKALSPLSKVKASRSLPEFPQLIHSDFAERTGVYAKLQDRTFTGIGSTADLPADPLEARTQHFNRVNIWSATGTSGCKLSLRYSVWSHDPTNDLRVIRFCLSTPIEQFVHNGMDRALIRRSSKGWLPDSIRLNQRTRGIQAADSIHRMRSDWPVFIDELEHICRDSRMQQFINMPVLQEALTEAREGLDPNQAYSPSIKLLMRSIILYRFLEKNF